MALIVCKECGQEMSENAKVCPHCGNPNNKDNKKKEYFILGICIALIILIIIGGIFSIRSASTTYKYSRATIKVLEQYKNDEIDEEEAMEKLDKLGDELDEIQKEEDSSKLLSLELDISSIHADFLLDKITLSELDNYIFKLKTRY